jgi:hypothetical protein
MLLTLNYIRIQWYVTYVCNDVFFLLNNHSFSSVKELIKAPYSRVSINCIKNSQAQALYGQQPDHFSTN